jgi:filamentous hemagglutinin family protein
MIQARTTTASASWAASGSEAWRGQRLTVRAGLLASVATICLGGVAAAQSLPSGGSVAQGEVSIAQPGANSMTITQGTNSAVVNWQSFSIGSGAHVDIRQPDANASMLNRVTGDTTSEIHGRLTANGQVHLVNPNGIFIGPNGTVDAGAFVASTLDISDEDFAAGRLRYRGLGSSATVENAGRVSIGRGGYAALLGGRVRNSGVVTVPMGRMAFGSGERAVLDLSGDHFLQVAVPTGGEDGEEALIENSGLASAQGGLVEMRAATAREAVRQAVNMTGVAEARSVSVRNGAIVLGGGAGGTVNVTGQVSTRSEPSALIIDESPRPPQGPEIAITGQRIRLAGAEIDASGDGGGGLIRIGGDFAGAGDLPRADVLEVDGTTTILADALDDGDGGRIAMWSDLRTDFAGFASARGGESGGDGGFIEVSSKQTLNYAGLTDRRAPHGKWGMLLLDPTDITIDFGAGGEASLEADLANGDVTLDTSSGGCDFGDITINADIDWTAPTTLVLDADRDIILNGSISAPSGGLEVFAIDNIDASGDVSVASFSLGNGNWLQFATPAAFSADNFSIDQFISTFVRTAGGSGTPGDPFQIFDIYGLQGIGTYGPNFVLANDIDAAATSNWTKTAVNGFEPIQTLNGTFDGAGFTISNLFQSQNFFDGIRNAAGLFDTIGSSGTVTDLTIANADFFGRQGGVLANSNTGTLRNVRASGTLRTEGGDTGGMVGSSLGAIEDSVADVAVDVTASGQSHRIGGFVGFNQGTFDSAHATGPVSVTNVLSGSSIDVGGFVGEESSVGPQFGASAYATGDVTVTSEVGPTAEVKIGGFVGDMNGAIIHSYSTGQVLAIGDPTLLIGGFAGEFVRAVGDFGNFWDVDTSGQASSPNGTGLSTADFQNTETFLTHPDAANWDFATTWAPSDTGFYPVHYSTTPVIFATPNDFIAVYGTTPTATTSASPAFPVAGGPSDFVFDETNDTLDTTGLFDSLSYPAGENVGVQPFGLATTNLTSVQNVNYRVVDRLGEVTITPAPLDITATDETKTYGNIFTPTRFTVSGLAFSDAVSSVVLTSAGAAQNASVGTYAIEVSNAAGTGLGNYAITYTPGALDVTPAALTVTATDETKTYGNIFTPTRFTVSGLAFSDAVSSVVLTSAGAAQNASVGTYAIEVSNAAGTGLGNYAITYTPGALDVTAAPLTITPNDQVKTFGTTFVFNGTEFTATGFVVAGDGVDEVFLVSDGAPAAAGAGDYPIRISGFRGRGLGNYDITEGTGTMTVQGEQDIVPRPPVVTVGFPQNPRDTIEGGGFDDPSGVISGGGGQIERQRAAETFAKVQDVSGALEIAADSCGESSGDVSRYLACLSDALDDFAGELDAISLDLPPGMENVAQIIQTARSQIDGAATRAASRLADATTEAERQAIRRDAANEARAALNTASNEIRKAITLVRAEDPELANLQRATITTVASAVDTVGIELSRVTDL